MKKTNLILMIICCYALTVSSQSLTTTTLLNEIKGHWSLDENGKVTYVKIIEDPELTKEEIYHRVLNHFIYSCSSGKGTIQMQDKTSGLIVAKDLFNDVYTRREVGFRSLMDCWYIVRADVKEGRARIMLTLLMYDETALSGDGIFLVDHSSKVEETFPINPKGKEKNLNGKTFYHSHFRALASLEAIEEAIKSGNSLQFGKKEDW